MRKGTSEYAMMILFDVGIFCKTPIGDRLIESGIDCSFIYGEQDWVLLVDEEYGKKITEKFYLVDKSTHNMHMDNPDHLT